MKSRIQESTEDYLETILVLSRHNSYVRSIDIVNELGFSKPSVSVAMKKLRESGHISMDENGYITLNDSGLEIALKTYERHTLLTRLVKTMGVSSETASEDACRVEHFLSQETFDCIKDYVNRNSLLDEIMPDRI